MPNVSRAGQIGGGGPEASGPEALPVAAVFPELLGTLEARNAAVLIAPPGAGKTTGVPPQLLAAAWRDNRKIIVVEPRRLAARAAAARVAAMLGEAVGGSVGYRVRNETRVSAATRVEFVTAGVFVRVILDDPALGDVAAVLLDEVHERAVDMDLALALTLDAQAGLRDDLRVLAMSATLDGRRFAELLGGAPVVESQGRLFPVQTRYLGADPALRVEDRIARAVRTALADESGSILAFLPGQGEIVRTAERIAERLPPNTILAPLFGAMDPRAQDAAIRPAPPGQRKIVLATSIAETSLTIEGVRVVIDSGLARRPRYEPGSGLSRLETVRVSRAAADQRRGRAGRTGPGVCLRLWDEPQNAALLPFDRPEILETDLAPLALTLLAWGVADPGALRWLDPPPAAAYGEALDLLERLGARDRSGGLSAHGRRLADLPLSPRLANMVLAGAGRGEARLATEIAAILSDPGLGGRDTDLRHRLESLRRDRSERARAARDAARRWEGSVADARAAAGAAELGPAGLLALAFPERVAQRRGVRGKFRMANGSGARLEETDALAGEAFLAVAEAQGGGPDSRIVIAAPIGRAELAGLFAERIRTEETVTYDAAADALRAMRVTRLDALVLEQTAIEVPDVGGAARLLLQAALGRGIGALPWPDDLQALRGRIAFLRRRHPDWPDLSDAALTESAAEWLLPALAGKRRLAELTAGDLRDALSALLPWARRTELDRLAPPLFTAPSGAAAPIDYSSGEPVVRIRVQNLFGLQQHPAVLGGAVPILFELLSPASRPLQVTRDLPAFWSGSWRDVRADMRGRYPKHSWPENPAAAEPLAGAKRRG